MASSDTNIANRALSFLHEPPIEDLTEDSNSARRCRLLWDDTRDFVMREHHWSCLTKRKVLAVAGSTEFGGLSKFRLPNDFIAIVTISDADATIEGDYLLSTADSIQLSYTARKTNPNEYNSEFKEAFAYRLAADLAKSDDKEKYLNFYKEFIADLKFQDANKNKRVGY